MIPDSGPGNTSLRAVFTLRNTKENTDCVPLRKVAPLYHVPQSPATPVLSP